jgi:hypothetical protein
LYSIIEFRELVYNTDSITYSNRSKFGVNPKYDINESFYRFKYLFYLLNKDLVNNTYDKYDVNDINVVCSRSKDTTLNNKFYNDIYKDLINDVITLYNNQNGATNNIEIDALNTCDFSEVKLIYYLEVFNDITCKLFSYTFDNNQNNYIFMNNDPNISKYNIVFNKYIIIGNAFITDNIINFKIKKINNRYILIGLIVSAHGHFWYLIKNHSTNGFIEINDLGKINNSFKFDLNIHDIRYGLYVREGEKYVDTFPITDQIYHLAQISHKINTKSINNLDCLNYEILSNIIRNKLK